MTSDPTSEARAIITAALNGDNEAVVTIMKDSDPVAIISGLLSAVLTLVRHMAAERHMAPTDAWRAICENTTAGVAKRESGA